MEEERAYRYGSTMFPSRSRGVAGRPPAGAPSPVVPAAPRASLWRKPDYMKVWSATTISLMGSQVSGLAIPFVAAVLLRATPIQVAMLGAVGMLPCLLFSLPAGAVLDRVRRRPFLVVGNLGRAFALATIPLAFALGHLSVYQLYVVGFVNGTLSVFFEIASQSYLPALLDCDELVEGNSKLQIAGSASQTVGPSMAGALLSVVAAPFAIVADALSFVVGAALIGAIRKPEPAPDCTCPADGSQRTAASAVPARSVRRDVAEGLRYVAGNPYLAMIAGSTATLNLGTAIAMSIFPVFVYVQLGLTPAAIGLAASLASFGVLLGAVVAGPLARRFGVGPVIVGSMFLNGPATLAIAFAPAGSPLAIPVLAASQFLTGFAVVVYSVHQVSYRQAITPLEMQGRMNATMRFLVVGIMPIGSMIGGAIATLLPLRATILVGGAICSVAFLWLAASPVSELRAIPKPGSTKIDGEANGRPVEGSAGAAADGETELLPA